MGQGLRKDFVQNYGSAQRNQELIPAGSARRLANPEQARVECPVSRHGAMSTISGTSIGSRYFPALGKKNFRIFWTGQCVSLVGTWMQNVGQSWLVLELTGSPLKLGLVSALQFLPMMILALFAGPFIDRFPKRRTLMFTQSILMLLALALAIMTATGTVRYWMILILALLLGLVNTIDMPTRQAYVIELSGRAALMNAVSLNSAAFNLARMVGPAVAGALISAVGIAPCFFLNSLSFAAVIAALAFIDAPDRVPEVAVRSMSEVLGSVREGLGYIRQRKEIALPLALLAIISMVVINYNIFVPTFARGPLGRDAAGFGLLMTCMGSGSLLAALALAIRSRNGPSRQRLFGGAFGMSLALAVCGLQRDYILTCILLGIVGFCSITFTASTNATVQLGSDDEHRGRVMSVYALVFGGVTPIGGLYAGAVVSAAGPAICMVLSGSIGLVAAIALGFAARSRVGRKATG
jgi:MFS family permease